MPQHDVAQGAQFLERLRVILSNHPERKGNDERRGEKQERSDQGILNGFNEPPPFKEDLVPTDAGCMLYFAPFVHNNGTPRI